ncbi:MAG TPA: NAD(P)H-dependent oxidoreductase [Rhodanobacteraceae bacterium]|nr:NAD(P)H-dependent oxidoreductase [Rhodanobacteraceae bacterium]
MSKARDVAVLVGSLRKASYNRMVARALIELAPPSLALEIVEIGQLPLYNQDYDADSPPEYAPFRERIARADAVLFVTPEHNRSVPAALKNAIDVASRPWGKSAWAGKPAGVLSASIGSPGAFGANHHLRQSLTYLDMPALQQPEIYIGKVQDRVDEASATVTAQSTLKLLGEFMGKFEAWVERNVASR